MNMGYHILLRVVHTFEVVGEVFGDRQYVCDRIWKFDLRLPAFPVCYSQHQWIRYSPNLSYYTSSLAVNSLLTPGRRASRPRKGRGSRLGRFRSFHILTYYSQRSGKDGAPELKTASGMAQGTTLYSV